MNSEANKFEDLTGSVHGSKLLKWINDNTQENISLKTYKNTLKGWFEFIGYEFNIQKTEWMKYLRN